MSRVSANFVARGRRILFVGVSLLGYLTAAFGLPLPVWTAKDRSVPFPCQDRPCGCHSAAECWQSCCCFSREEHLAWARANNVEPPAGYAEGGWNDRPQRHEGADCCQGQKHCCSTEDPAACDLTGPGCDSSIAVPTSPTSTPYVLGSLYLTCRGMTVAWAQSGAALPAATLVSFTMEFPPGGLLAPPNTSKAIQSLAPPLPPPRWLVG